MFMGLGAVLAAAILYAGPNARADGPGCVSQFWMYGLRASTRRLCDGPRLPDGSWNRSREFYAPATYVPMTCNWNSYGGYCTGGYTLPELSILTIYPVTDQTVLPDEPGWIAP